jgi:hypothetical protein
MKDLYDYKAAREVYDKTTFRISKCGNRTGRVARGAVQVLTDTGFTKVRPIDVKKGFDKPVFTQQQFYYAKRKDGEVDDANFHQNPGVRF